MTMGKGKVKTEPIEVDLEEGFGEPVEGLLDNTGGAEDDTVA
jgi:hypothetical protein